jgi:Protein of unknown function (DUF732)
VVNTSGPGSVGDSREDTILQAEVVCQKLGKGIESQDEIIQDRELAGYSVYDANTFVKLAIQFYCPALAQ